MHVILEYKQSVGMIIIV